MPRRILIADDDQDLRAIVSDFLKANGFDVQTAVDGEEALTMIDQDRPDLLILDMSMPRRDGWSVARELRQRPGPRLPIIAFTAHALMGDESKVREAGCDELVTKPFDVMELLEKVRLMLP